MAGRKGSLPTSGVVTEGASPVLKWILHRQRTVFPENAKAMVPGSQTRSTRNRVRES